MDGMADQPEKPAGDQSGKDGKPKIGRPTRLTETIVVKDLKGEQQTTRVCDEILRRIESGVSPAAAAQSIGISRGAFNEWIARGENRDPERPPTPDYVAFAAEVHSARARGRAVLELYVRQGSKEDGRLALEALARMYPDEWGRRDRIYLRHAIKIEDLGEIADRVFDVICRHVVDVKVREAIATELAEVLEDGAPTPMRRIDAHVVDGNGDPGRDDGSRDAES